MKLKDLEFRRVGCCGEYLNASANIGGVVVIVTDHEDGTFSVARARDGKLLGSVSRGVTSADVDSALLAEAD